MGCSIYEKISKSRFLTLHISEPFWPRNLKIFLWCHVHLKIYQKKFQIRYYSRSLILSTENWNWISIKIEFFYSKGKENTRVIAHSLFQNCNCHDFFIIGTTMYTYACICGHMYIHIYTYIYVYENYIYIHHCVRE